MLVLGGGFVGTLTTVGGLVPSLLVTWVPLVTVVDPVALPVAGAEHDDEMLSAVRFSEPVFGCVVALLMWSTLLVVDTDPDGPSEPDDCTVMPSEVKCTAVP